MDGIVIFVVIVASIFSLLYYRCATFKATHLYKPYTYADEIIEVKILSENENRVKIETLMPGENFGKWVEKSKLTTIKPNQQKETSCTK